MAADGIAKYLQEASAASEATSLTTTHMELPSPRCQIDATLHGATEPTAPRSFAGSRSPRNCRWEDLGWNCHCSSCAAALRMAEKHILSQLRRGDDSEMSERLATEQPLKEYALAWDMRSYTLAEFINYYGVPEAHDFWQPSLHATADARAAIKNLHEVDGPAMANFWALISGWVPTAPTVEAANDLMLSAFYIPLRWRYEFLQSRGVLPEMWSSCDLSAQQDQKATWAYVKDSVATFALTPQQRALGRRNILALVINKLCKNTHLCKLLLNYGVADAQSLTTILGALAVRRARPQPHAQQQQQEHQAVTVAAQHTIDVPRAQATLRLRSRSRTRVPRYN